MYSVVSPCAGKGSRTKLNVNKLLYKVDGLHLVEYTIEKFIYDPDFTEIILVVAKSEIKKFEMFTSNKIKIVEGGKMRQDSVFKGVSAASNEIVFIHDGARPLLSSKIINKCKEAMNYHDSCVVGYPLNDSLKEIEDGVVTLIIEDQGPGIVKEIQPLIFKDFFYGNSTPTWKVKASGLGLALVKHYLNAHNGSIKLLPATKSYCGARFSISLPQKPGTSDVSLI